VCTDGECQAPSCDDGVKNGEESDVDCGGESCEPCNVKLECAADEDCESNVCTRGMCMAATCSDGVENGDEDGVDCGGECGACLDPSKGTFVGGSRGCSVTAPHAQGTGKHEWLWLLVLAGALVSRRRTTAQR
jgi:MYXO-CTERM domain-containing protein